MTGFQEALGMVAPYYNLVFVLIVLIMFLKLFSLPNKKIFLKPWKLLFAAVVIFIIEEMLTVFKIAGIAGFELIPRITNAYFELAIITIFVYMLLIQKEHLKENPSIKKSKKKKNAK